MHDAKLDVSVPARSPSWKWWVCGLLLLATMLNYMDRQTLAQMSEQIQEELSLDSGHYGIVEACFAIAFASGAILAGFVVDRWNVFWVYPAALVAWSVMGFLTGYSSGFYALVVCRTALGLFEAANWPCAMRTTQRILEPAQRTMGNSILQSGASIGAILTPAVVWILVTGPGTWRLPFWVIGAVGLGWVVLWAAVVRPADLALPGRVQGTGPGAKSGDVTKHDSIGPILRDRRFWVCVCLVITINLCWHFLRAWLPLILRRVDPVYYTKDKVLLFSSAYYVATDLGALAAGFATLRLAKMGMSVHRSRVAVFLTASLITTLTVPAALLPPGPVVLALLLVIGFGSLALFPPYYSLSQELTVRHQGKVTGTLGFSTWMMTALMQFLVGLYTRATGDFTTPLALAGLIPLLGLVALLAFWKEPAPAPRPSLPGEEHIREAPSDKLRGVG